jgi:hypothetical protein
MAKKNLTIWTKCKDVINRCIAIVSTKESVLLNPLVCAFRQKRNAIHESNNVVNFGLSLLHHISIFPHLMLVWKPNLSKWMIPQFPHHLAQHFINYAAADRGGYPK